MEINNYEGIIHKKGTLKRYNQKYRVKVKININNEIYSLKLHGMDANLIVSLKEKMSIKFKGILDKEKKEIKNYEDVWIKII